MENVREDEFTNDSSSEASAVPSQDAAAPDGGCRAWLMALSCCFINVCITSVALLMLLAMTKFEDVFGTKESNEITKALKYTQEVGLIVGGVLMDFIGYRIIGSIGCAMIGFGLFVTSFLEEGDEKAVVFLTGVVTGTGFAFTHLATTVPILECFVTKRILAIVLVRFGQYLTIIIYTAIVLSVETLEYEWNHLLRYQLLGSCIALMLCFTLKQYYQKEKAALKDLFIKHKALYAFAIVFFFDQFGKNVVDVNYLVQTIVKQLDNPTLKDVLVVGLSPSVGLIVGLIVVFVLMRFERMKKLTSILLLMAVLNILSGSFTLAFYKHMKEAGILAFYGLLYGTTSGTFSSVLDNTIPEEFDMQNVRVVEAVLGLASSLGGIAAGESVEDINGEDKTFTQFNLAGALIFVSGTLALVYAILRLVKIPEKLKILPSEVWS